MKAPFTIAAARGEFHLAHLAFEQVGPQALLQRLDLMTDGGGCQAKLIGGPDTQVTLKVCEE